MCVEWKRNKALYVFRGHERWQGSGVKKREVDTEREEMELRIQNLINAERCHEAVRDDIFILF